MSLLLILKAEFVWIENPNMEHLTLCQVPLWLLITNWQRFNGSEVRPPKNFICHSLLRSSQMVNTRCLHWPRQDCKHRMNSNTVAHPNFPKLVYAQILMHLYIFDRLQRLSIQNTDKQRQIHANIVCICKISITTNDYYRKRKHKRTT